MTTVTTTEQNEAPLTLPEGVELQQCTGAATGNTLYKIRGFEMPWSTSPRVAVELYERLKKAYESGYFSGAANHKAHGQSH